MMNTNTQTPDNQNGIKYLIGQIGQIVAVVTSAIALIVNFYMLPAVQQEVFDVEPTVIANIPFDPFKDNYLILLTVIVIPSIFIFIWLLYYPLSRVKTQYPQYVQRANGVYILIAAALFLWGVWRIDSWQSREFKDNRIVIIVNDVLKKGEDANRFYQNLQTHIQGIRPGTPIIEDDVFYLDIWLKQVPGVGNSTDAFALDSIKRNAHLETVLWINYTDNPGLEPDIISFTEYKREFERWSPQHLPMLEPTVFGSRTPPPGTLSTLSSQTIAGIYLKIAIMYYSDGNDRGAWKILEYASSEDGQTSEDDQTPSVLDYLKEDPTYLYLLARLVPWAENNSGSTVDWAKDILRNSIEDPEARINSSATVIYKEYYKLYLLQLHYTLFKIDSIPEQLTVQLECTDNITTDKRVRVGAWLRLKSDILYNYPEMFSKSDINDMMNQLLKCDNESIESLLVASQIYRDFANSGIERDENLEEAWKKLYQVLYLTRYNDRNDRVRQEVYWLCLAEMEMCPTQDLDEIVQWTKTWGIGVDKRVFRFGQGWDSAYRGHRIPTGAPILLAEQKSNSVMTVAIQPLDDAQGENNYEYRAFMTCGSNSYELSTYGTPVASSTIGPSLSFDLFIGDQLQEYFPTEFLQVNPNTRQIEAICNLRLTVINNSIRPGELEYDIQRNIKVMGRPSISISDPNYHIESAASADVTISVVVPYGLYSSTQTLTYTRAAAEGTIPRICAIPWEGNELPDLEDTPSCSANDETEWSDSGQAVASVEYSPGSPYYLVIAEITLDDNGTETIILKDRKVFQTPG